METRLDVFLAHTASGRVAADRLYEILSPSCSVFLDSRSIRPGQSWAVAIAEAQTSSRMTVILLSDPTGNPSFYQGEEIATAIRLMRNGDHRCIPVYLNGVAPEDGPYGLRSLQSVQVADLYELQGLAQIIMDELSSPLMARDAKPQGIASVGAPVVLSPDSFRPFASDEFFVSPRIPEATEQKFRKATANFLGANFVLVALAPPTKPSLLKSHKAGYSLLGGGSWYGFGAREFVWPSGTISYTELSQWHVRSGAGNNRVVLRRGLRRLEFNGSKAFVTALTAVSRWVQDPPM